MVGSFGGGCERSGCDVEEAHGGEWKECCGGVAGVFGDALSGAGVVSERAAVGCGPVFAPGDDRLDDPGGVVLWMGVEESIRVGRLPILHNHRVGKALVKLANLGRWG